MYTYSTHSVYCGCQPVRALPADIVILDTSLEIDLVDNTNDNNNDSIN